MKRVITIFMIMILLIPTSLTVVYGVGYTVPLPTNAFYAEDFENYSNGQNIGFGASQVNPSTIGGQGWGNIDHDTGGTANITSSNYLSCCKSLLLRDSTSLNGKYDVDRRFGLPTNGTSQITLSVWVAFTYSMNGANLNNFHIALETWSKTLHYEALTFFYYQTGPSCVEADFITATGGTGTTGSVDHLMPYCMEAWDHPTGTIEAYWHHIIVSADISRNTWKSVQVDGMDFTSTVKDLGMRTLSDTSLQNYNPPFGFRMEFAVQNAVASPAYWVWFDDVIITDTSPGQPSIIQFAVNGSAIILLMFIGIIGILYYLRIGDRLMFGKGKGLFGSRTIIKYPEKSTTAEQEAKKMVKTIMIILVIGAILTAFALYFTGFI